MILEVVDHPFDRIRQEDVVGIQVTDDLSAGQMASAEPKTIRAEDLASKALEVMETWQITSLVIVDEARRPVGLIHLHDILRAKIV